ncbi:MAG: protein-(glutamine-N5) methyltransferase, release factor-specific [Devosia sp. 67-54]|uniref:peptide chain release factor N(5)-glutamine methyltransferase n=1 Tax=unclassified Devosia TaxID=196773 RepID=UPI00095937FD|nr:MULTISPECIES: peptide chain release factor N(5)-glutamine methyltransferase [unclassified Devosia]MBN9307303.1 peptide chain release factor N(5)-glutamine methyltransferase [Devosia sp.]OJX19778.1 MAG: protein-(glutamine-N5) methyltransferase, release factor-specific [Devosia sp. 67-54]
MSAPVAIGVAWRQVRDRFRAAGLDTPELDARLLAQTAFGLDAMGLVRRERQAATPEQLVELDRFALRRLAGEPVSRIAGEQEFWGLRFALSDATLVPRPETEQLVEEALARLAGQRAPRIVDLGTGSGAIIVSILEALPKARGFATDISEAALATARQNAERHGVAARLDVRQGAWWQAVPHTELFDLIVSNPPYIATAAIAELAPEVRVFDPKVALDGGWDGLEAYRAIASQAARRLVPKGQMLLEIGYNQAEAVRRVFSRAGFGRVEILKDLAGLDRVVVASHS